MADELELRIKALAETIATDMKTKPTVKITVGTTAPISPSTGDLWVDTN